MQKMNDIVAISGLLLALTTFLFNLALPKINQALQLDEHMSGEIARQKARKQVRATLLLPVLPLFLAFFALFYVNLPAAMQIVANSSLRLWHFEVDRTLYVLVECALLAFVIYHGWLIYRLAAKSRKFGGGEIK